MGGQVVIKSDDEVLIAYATAGTYRGAAKLLGQSYPALRRRLQRLALRGQGAPPEGFHAVQVVQDKSGRVTSVKSRPDPDEGEHVDTVPEGHTVKGISTFIGEGGRVVGQWIKTKANEVSREDFEAAITAHCEQYRRAWVHSPASSFPPPHTDAALLNAFVWGDPHIGLLAHARETGANFDLKIAVADLKRSAELLVAKAPRAATAFFIETGDLWHAQDDKQTTPRGGNKLDVDGRKSKILEQGLDCTRNMIDLMLEAHDRVVIAIVPGNHDPDHAIVTRIWLQAVYQDHPRVEILDNANPYMYFDWGSNLWMLTHGDKRVKPQELGEIMTADCPELIARCRHRRAYTGHIHHKNVQEFRTFRWESFNSLCAADFWHHSEGYRSERLVECVTFHSRFGETARCRVTHQELREAA